MSIGSLLYSQHPERVRHIVGTKGGYLLSAGMNVKYTRTVNRFESIVFVMKQDQQVTTNWIFASHPP